MQDQDTRFSLSIPIEDALEFAMGESDLGYGKVSGMMRQVVGVLLIDTLEYAEHWRIAAEVRALLAERWPASASFQTGRNLR